jgi:hypothetical protein
VALWLLVAAVVPARGAPPDPGDQIFFSKSFPGSKPEYFEVGVDSEGNTSYREDPADQDPLVFTLGDQETREVFDLAEKLARFQRPLQADQKVAFTGMKTLKYRTAAGGESGTEFTYSTDKDAQAIVQWFERMGETERHRIELERVVQFDRLGINKTILVFQAAFDAGRVVGARQFLPILKLVAGQSKFMHMARVRAAALVERIEGQEP